MTPNSLLDLRNKKTLCIDPLPCLHLTGREINFINVWESFIYRSLTEIHPIVNVFLLADRNKCKHGKGSIAGNDL